jgi:hypothetical protein
MEYVWWGVVLWFLFLAALLALVVVGLIALARRFANRNAKPS